MIPATQKLKDEHGDQVPHVASGRGWQARLKGSLAGLYCLVSNLHRVAVNAKGTM